MGLRTDIGSSTARLTLRLIFHLNFALLFSSTERLRRTVKYVIIS